LAQLSNLAFHRLDLSALIGGLPVFAAAIDIGLFYPTTQRVPATPDLWRDCHNRRRLIGVFVFMFKYHPNRARPHFS
jgi:hypothetical protein